MSNPNETTEEAIAALRRYADFVQKHSGEITVGHDALRELADRIEAAYKREIDEARKARDEARETAEDALWELAELRERAPGNASALRDLLEKIRHEYGWGRIGCRTCVSSEADVERVLDLFEKQIDAALAAPARNCDRPFRLFEEAIGAYVTERGDGPHLGYCDAIKWMLAPAEGGAE